MKGYVRISLVEVYERVEKSVISADERSKRLTHAFYRCEKDWERSAFVIYSDSKTSIERTPS